MRRARDLWPDFALALDIELARSGVRIEGRPAWRDEVLARIRALGAPETTYIAEDWRLDARQALSALRAAAQEAGAVFEAVAGWFVGLVLLLTFAFSALPVSGYSWGGAAAPKLVTRTQHNQNMFSLSFWTFCVSLAACTKSRSAKRFSGIWTKHG